MSFLYAKFGRAVIVGEVAMLGGTYYVYHNLTVDAAYRSVRRFIALCDHCVPCVPESLPIFRMLIVVPICHLRARMEEKMPRFMDFFHQATNGTYKTAPITAAPDIVSANPEASRVVPNSEK